MEDSYPGLGPLESGDLGREALCHDGGQQQRGYDPATGRELWRLGKSSKIAVPTPVFAEDLIIVASGLPSIRPIFAIRPGGRGDISPQQNQTSNQFVAWSKPREGPYIPTPIIYRGHVFVLSNTGQFDCYDLKSGEPRYRERVAHRGSGFSASPVAADGNLYLSSEDGDIFVVDAGPTFSVRSINPLGEPLMATPALSDGCLFVRGQRHVYAISK